MTSHRIISGFVFFGLLLLGLFSPPFFWIPPLIIVAGVSLGIWEFNHLSGVKPHKPQLIVSFLGAYALLIDGYFFSLGNSVAIIGMLAVLTIGLDLAFVRRGDIAGLAGKAVLAPIYTALPFALIVKLWQDNLNLDPAYPNRGAHYLLFLIFVTWSSDVGAYFFGRWFGKRKLAPKLSPGKTVEGFLGGVVMTLIVASGFKLFWNNIDVLFDWLDVLTLGLMFSVVGPIGDLAESKLKRTAAVKDSGQTFTGHGGMLDVIDSLLFTTIFYYVYLALFHPGAFPSF